MSASADRRAGGPMGGTSQRRGRTAVAVVVMVALLAACAGQKATEPPASPTPGPSTPLHGGTLRVVMPRDAQSAPTGQPSTTFLDPQFDGFGWTEELWRCCLVRTLVSHNGRSTTEGGSRLHPDLATALPEVSADGLTWTFHLKAGLHYAPPLQEVEITARDFIRGINRAVAPSLDPDNATGAVFLPTVVGVWDYLAGKAASISGLEAPDDHTLVMRLTEADGDWGPQMAIPAVMPLPADPAHPDAPFGVAQDAGTGYGRFLVSTGPYMLDGSADLDFSIPAAKRPAARGIAPDRITLVRNPSWDPASDDLRPAYPDRIEITLVDSLEQAVGALDAGRADLLWPEQPLPADMVAAFQADPARGTLRVDPTGMVRYLIMNLAVPPFDDLQVRKALTFAIDKQRLVELQGGPGAYGAIGHLVADSLEDDLLLEYDPYATPGGRGDLAAARTEITRSRYDMNGDGRCDAAACQHVRIVTRAPFGEVARAITADLEPLGIHLEVEVLEKTAFLSLPSDARARTPVLVGLAYLSPCLCAAPTLSMFDSRFSIETFGEADTANGTMIGATPEQLRRWGYTVTEVPNVDARIEACLPLIGAARFRCVAGVDQFLMETIVPWVPIGQQRFAAVTSSRVVSYGYDELVGMSALDQIALRP